MSDRESRRAVLHLEAHWLGPNGEVVALTDDGDLWHKTRYGVNYQVVREQCSLEQAEQYIALLRRRFVRVGGHAGHSAVVRSSGISGLLSKCWEALLRRPA